jgi:hypothetical protein
MDMMAMMTISAEIELMEEIKVNYLNQDDKRDDDITSDKSGDLIGVNSDR